MTQTSIGRRRTHAQHSRAQPAIEPNYHNWYSNIKITFSYCTSTSRRTHNHYIYKYIQKDSSVRPPAKAGGSVFLFSCRLWRAERPRRGRRPASRGLSSAGSVCGRGDRKNLAEASRPAPSPAPRRAPTLYTGTGWHRPPTHTHTHTYTDTHTYTHTRPPDATLHSFQFLYLFPLKRCLWTSHRQLIQSQELKTAWFYIAGLCRRYKWMLYLQVCT